MAKRKPKRIRTLGELKRAFADGTIDGRYWTTCIDSGGHNLRYVGPNTDGLEPDRPVELCLTTDPWELIEELMGMVGIPAERA